VGMGDGWKELRFVFNLQSLLLDSNLAYEQNSKENSYAFLRKFRVIMGQHGPRSHPTSTIIDHSHKILSKSNKWYGKVRVTEGVFRLAEMVTKYLKSTTSWPCQLMWAVPFFLITTVNH
jgi:hypothetical protein